jgi:hypothetical protein
MDELLQPDVCPASNHVSTSPSPNHDSSTYGTPGDANPPSPTMTGSDKDPQLVVSAGRSLKNMLVDLMAVLDTQAKTPIFIQGDITLRIEGRETYAVSLFNVDGVEPSDLKVRISKMSESVPEFPTGQSNGLEKAGSEAESSRKRNRDDNDHVDFPDGATRTPTKRTRVDSRDSEDNHHPMLETTHDQGNAQAERESSEPAPTVMSRLQNVSAQVKWVEECRRIADEAHDKREETWRTTSATFHDDNRKARERHEAWLVSEMAWQRNILVGMMNDLKGLYPLGHSLKWGKKYIYPLGCFF